jgi:BirA family biotin operon repressor/biotin-[acetyl-CoA-carboxylase] ligase
MFVSASTTSTNDDAKRGAKEGATHGTTWVVEAQTAGRGRQGRVWSSAPGEGLLFSVLARLTCPASRLPPLGLVAGLAVRDAIRVAAPGADLKLKWPNDVVSGGRKVAGVLVEAITSGSRVDAVVVGVGVNVHTRTFPVDLEGRATSVVLLGDAPSPPDRSAILADTLATLDRDLAIVAARGLGILAARLEAADALRGLRVRNDSGEEGVACGIDEDGRLKVRLVLGTFTRWSAGEVHLCRDLDRR